MKKLILLSLVLGLMLLSSCSTHTRIVYRDHNWNTSPFGIWWGNPYMGWGNYWNFYPYRPIPNYVIPRVSPPRVSPPTRYERRHTPPSRQALPNRGTDNTYPQRPSRIQNRPTTNLTPKWYVPQQSTGGTTTPMVTPQIIFEGPNGRGYSGPGGFGSGNN